MLCDEFEVRNDPIDQGEDFTVVTNADIKVAIWGFKWMMCGGY